MVVSITAKDQTDRSLSIVGLVFMAIGGIGIIGNVITLGVEHLSEQAQVRERLEAHGEDYDGDYTGNQ